MLQKALERAISAYVLRFLCTSFEVLCISLKGLKMPKMKTKSGVKKRFRLTGTGKVIATQAGKRHGMIKRTNKQLRNQRGTTILCEADARIVKQFMPYG
jgi:large subunit ribosomal protein L35